MLTHLSLPERSGLVVGENVDVYRFEFGESVFEITGDAIISSEGDGTITPTSAHHLAIIGTPILSIGSAEDISFCFDTVQFSGTVTIEAREGSSITFVSCAFDDDTTIVINGGPCDLRFIGTSFGKNSTIDCRGAELLSKPEIVDCFEEEGAGFMLGQVNDEISWAGPLLAIAALGTVFGAAAIASAKSKVVKVHEHQQSTK